MATKPTKTIKRDTQAIVNAIRNSNPVVKQYTQAVGGAESLRAFGEAISSNVPAKNAFLTELINRIGLVMINSKMYDNPLARFKKGILEYGETVEDIFVNLVKGIKYGSEDEETTVYKKHIPDVKALFHNVNTYRMYPATIKDVDLKKAFLSAEGVYDLISGIITAMYKSANIDEFVLMKYMLARAILDGRVTNLTIPAVTKESSSDIATTIHELSNNMVFPNTDYNHAGVTTYTDKAAQNILLTSKFSAYMNVNVLATAFNIDKVQFMGQQVLIDSLAKLDEVTLAEFIEGYTPLTIEEKAKLEKVQAVIIDESYYQVYDNEVEMREIYNPKGLYTNMFYHIWQVLSTTNFAQAVALIEE